MAENPEEEIDVVAGDVEIEEIDADGVEAGNELELAAQLMLDAHAQTVKREQESSAAEPKLTPMTTRSSRKRKTTEASISSVTTPPDDSIAVRKSGRARVKKEPFDASELQVSTSTRKKKEAAPQQNASRIIFTNDGCPVSSDVVPQSHRDAVPTILNVDNCVNEGLVCDKVPFDVPRSRVRANFVFVVSSENVQSIDDLFVDDLSPWETPGMRLNSSQALFWAEESVCRRVTANADANLMVKRVTGTLPRCQRLEKTVFYGVDPNSKALVGYIIIAYSYRCDGLLPVPNESSEEVPEYEQNPPEEQKPKSSKPPPVSSIVHKSEPLPSDPSEDLECDFAENGAVIYSHDLPSNCDDALRMILNLGNCIDKRLLSTRRPFMPPACEETGDYVFVLDMGNGANAEMARKDLNFDGLSPWNTKGSARMASKVLYYKVEENEYVKVPSSDQANVLLRKIYGVLPRCNRISKRLFYAEDISTNHIIGYVIICYSYVQPGPMPDRVIPRGYGAAQERMSRLKAGSDDCDPGIDLTNILPPSSEYATISPDGQPVYSNTIPTVSDVILPLIFNIDNVVDQNRVCSQLPFLPPDCTGIGDFLFVVNPSALKKYRYVTIDGLIPWNSRDQKMCNRQFFYEVEESEDGKPVKFTRKLTKQGSNLLFRKICGSLPRDSRLTKRIFYAISLPKRKLAGYVLVSYSFTYPGPMPVQVYENEDHAFSLRRLRAMQDRQNQPDDSDEEEDDDEVFMDDTLGEVNDEDEAIICEQGCPIYAKEIPKTSDDAVNLLLDIKKSINPDLVSKRQPFMPPSFTGIGQFLFVIAPAAVKSVKDVTVDGLAPWNSKDRKMATKFIYYRRDGEDVLTKVAMREQADIVLRKVHGVLPRCPRIVKKIYYALDAKTEETIGYILIGYQYRYRGAMPTPVAHGNSKRQGHAFQRMFPSTLCEMKNLLKENLPAVAMQKAAEKAMKDEASSQHPCATPNNIHVLYNLAKYVPGRVKRTTMKDMRDKDTPNDILLRRNRPHTVVRPRQPIRGQLYPGYARPNDASALLAKIFSREDGGNESDDNEDEIDVVNVQPAKRMRSDSLGEGPSSSRGPRYTGYTPRSVYRQQVIPARRGVPPNAAAHASRIEWLQNNKNGDRRGWLLNASSRTLASSPSALQSAIMSAVEAEVTAELEDIHYGGKPLNAKEEEEGDGTRPPVLLPRSGASTSAAGGSSTQKFRVFRRSHQGGLEELHPLTVAAEQASERAKQERDGHEDQSEVVNESEVVEEGDQVEEGTVYVETENGEVYQHYPVEAREGQYHQIEDEHGVLHEVVQLEDGQLSQLPQGQQYYVGADGEVYMEWDGSTPPEGVEVYDEEEVDVYV
ncbi:hypothetical protein QR680_004761 [Steinernema hermaphroditum]|uniref:DUF7747 domain-containing protein n=1 Tax=Steinernema hermaphroditum TaxID=289476 RepID=A0AA39HPR0_9BILA|nr:hypothetical protein QR680_004761 [Steinernema hermaphroditum]